MAAGSRSAVASARSSAGGRKISGPNGTANTVLTYSVRNVGMNLGFAAVGAGAGYALTGTFDGALTGPSLAVLGGNVGL